MSESTSASFVADILHICDADPDKAAQLHQHQATALQELITAAPPEIMRNYPTVPGEDPVDKIMAGATENDRRELIDLAGLAFWLMMVAELDEGGSPDDASRYGNHFLNLRALNVEQTGHDIVLSA